MAHSGHKTRFSNLAVSAGAIRHLVAAIAALLLAACAPTAHTDFPVTAQGQAALVDNNVNIIRLTPQNIGEYGRPANVAQSYQGLSSAGESWRYLVGVGDVLSITVWDHPELTLPAGPERSQIESGSWVNADGKIFYPFIGLVHVAGRTINQIQQNITEKLAEYIPDPQIEVKVAAFNSQKVIITGAVVQAGSAAITNIPLNLLDAVNSAGGLSSAADSRRISVLRNGRTYNVNLNSFLSNARHGGNPVLRGGDIVNIPALQNNVAYVLGQVQEPGSVDLGLSGVNLTEALTRHGGLVEQSADAKGIFVFRQNRENTGFDVFQLNATTPLAFVLATEFSLHPQDVIYVVTDPAARWNAVIASLVPSISAIRGVQVIGGDL